MAFKMRSGNAPAFKMMGSSPMKQDESTSKRVTGLTDEEMKVKRQYPTVKEPTTRENWLEMELKGDKSDWKQYGDKMDRLLELREDERKHGRMGAKGPKTKKQHLEHEAIKRGEYISSDHTKKKKTIPLFVSNTDPYI